MTDYSRELNKGMKVFSQLYVGLKDQGRGSYLGFATPLEKGSAFEKRKDTIHRWLGVRNPIIENGRYKTDEKGNIVKLPEGIKPITVTDGDWASIYNSYAQNIEEIKEYIIKKTK